MLQWTVTKSNNHLATIIAAQQIHHRNLNIPIMSEWSMIYLQFYILPWPLYFIDYAVSQGSSLDGQIPKFFHLRHRNLLPNHVTLLNPTPITVSFPLWNLRPNKANDYGCHSFPLLNSTAKPFHELNRTCTKCIDEHKVSPTQQLTWTLET